MKPNVRIWWASGWRQSNRQLASSALRLRGGIDNSCSFICRSRAGSSLSLRRSEETCRGINAWSLSSSSCHIASCSLSSAICSGEDLFIASFNYRGFNGLPISSMVWRTNFLKGTISWSVICRLHTVHCLVSKPVLRILPYMSWDPDIRLLALEYAGCEHKNSKLKHRKFTLLRDSPRPWRLWWLLPGCRTRHCLNWFHVSIFSQHLRHYWLDQHPLPRKTSKGPTFELVVLCLYLVLEVGKRYLGLLKILVRCSRLFFEVYLLTLFITICRVSGRNVRHDLRAWSYRITWSNSSPIVEGSGSDPTSLRNLSPIASSLYRYISKAA